MHPSSFLIFPRIPASVTVFTRFSRSPGFTSYVTNSRIFSSILIFFFRFFYQFFCRQCQHCEHNDCSSHIHCGMLFGKHGGQYNQYRQHPANPYSPRRNQLFLHFQCVLQHQCHIDMHAWEYTFRRIHGLYKLQQISTQGMKIIDNALAKIKSCRPHIGDKQENIHPRGQNQNRFFKLSVIQIFNCQHCTHYDVRKPAHIWINKDCHIRNSVIQRTMDQMHILRRYDLQKSK